MDIQISAIDSLGLIPQLIEIIPELDAPSPDQLATRLGPTPLLLTAYAGEKRVGFKLGYPISTSCFYSWLGGVAPEYRRHGIAKMLLHAQETEVKRLGYTRIRVKSMNRFPSMLTMLIQQHYQIIGTEETGPENLKVLFEKAL